MHHKTGRDRQTAGLVIGHRGGIVVDDRMRTSDPAIYAVGAAIEVRDVVVGQEVILPLARGIDALNLSGGYTTWQALQAAGMA